MNLTVVKMNYVKNRNYRIWTFQIIRETKEECLNSVHWSLSELDQEKKELEGKINS